MMQPEPDMGGRFGNGWKGVWKWCETNQGSLNTYMNSLTPVLDFLVIHVFALANLILADRPCLAA